MVIIFAVGIGAGIGGTLLVLLLHSIQHIAYGYSPDKIISHISFLEGVRASSPQKIMMVMTLCGLVAGLGWWVLHRYGKPLVSIAEVVKSHHPQMPMLTTLAHILLQIITIALGSPLGREVAPREISTLFAGWLSVKMQLSLKNTQLMCACGAGAGLAAVYNVPLGGAMFTLEVLLGSLHWTAALPALATSSIAVLVSWISLGNEPLYHINTTTVNHSLLIWSLCFGPIIGFVGYFFSYIAKLIRNLVGFSWKMPVFCLLNFFLIGILATYFPSILGNGKSIVQLEFDNASGIGVVAFLFLIRTLITWSSLGVGAQGGLLTPSLANGALFGVLLGSFWNLIGSVEQLNIYAMIGATAFLAAAQKMPLTAIILVCEFTRINLNFLMPILVAVIGAVYTAKACEKFFSARSKLKSF